MMKQEIPHNSLFFFVLSIITMMLLILSGLSEATILEILLMT